MDRRTDGQTDRRTDGQTDGRHNDFSRAHFLKMCSNNDNIGTIFLSRHLAATKKLGTCTILMKYEQLVKRQFFDNDHFSKKKQTFGQLNFRSIDFSVK
jgi:hypothetical protein